MNVLYDPRFTVQCISNAIDSIYQCDRFLSVVVAETTKNILFLTCVNNILRLLTCILYQLWHSSIFRKVPVKYVRSHNSLLAKYN